MRYFSVLAKRGSLSGAARTLGVEHATVARRIAGLEADLHVKLVDRRGRRILLTPEGERIAAAAGRIEDEAASIERLAAGAQAQIAGTVSISAPPLLAAARLVRPLADIRKAHPKLTIRLVGENRSARLEKREADIAIRLSRPESGAQTISKLGEMPFNLYASLPYLQATRPEDWSFIGYESPLDQSPPQKRLRLLAGQRPIGLTASTIEIQLSAAKEGFGVAFLPDFVAAGDAELARVFPEEPPVIREIWLVVHNDLKDAPAVRTVLNALKAAFASTPRI
ncbi:LysR family transcriptional regulator [Hwanghaeella grinnelliae]|uniref:LysR family transcriptional regulator n=1 Tax=Hwanghaeella grinnelliae TaxID=2500179 RepID=UPI001961B0E0|nr:LysR family transcriptional regulator [Hwanghaeella grinnelliae]